MASASESKGDTVSFLQTTNPEVFQAVPRPGGYIKLKNDKNVEEAKKLVEKESREFRVQTALDDDNFSIASIEAPIPAPLKDAMYMLGTTISTLIMMAADFKNITNQHWNWAEKYLDCVKDDYGHHPPNVQGILNHIRKNKPSGGDTGGGTGGDVEQTVRSTTRVKVGSQSEE